MSAHVFGIYMLFFNTNKNDGEKHLGKPLGFLHSGAQTETPPSDIPR